ncbi:MULTISPECIES: BrnT family toxin [Glaesserella]|uniref:BrnT family toxin n=1 Tax=Glaesserella australis TaxID=2094024 RepID=A0A328C0G9_9PAST|nr:MULTISPECIES: BrnT family toxin [Glaesserella]AUI66371.1 hypothetical protein CJD39_07150 [Glaesserella sp. 15-184]RAL19415.1 hypothetical protein C5N92_02920 [Glaesserella australis]
MKFSWDEQKAKTNLLKHKVSFDDAILVFYDEFMWHKQDRIEQGEMRWQAIGMAANQVILLVAHTWNDIDGIEHIRIISARPATKKERQQYEQNRYTHY